MFTGIIQEIGTIVTIGRKRNASELTISVSALPDDIKTGDSIAIEGVCLTVTSRTANSFTVDAVEETLSRSTLNYFRQGERVNVEYALKTGDRLGGHYVQGHIDGTGTIQNIRELESSVLYSVMLPEELSQYCIEKGSIALDGISLTIAALKRSEITVSIIPHTRRQTTLQFKNVGSRVNVEVDVIGKYVKRFLDNAHKKEGISEDFLRRTGFLE